MNRTENQFRIAMEILREYKGNEPFHLYLRETFKKKRSGSSDRRFIRTLTYAALRVRKAIPKENPDRQILLGLLLTEPVFSDEIKHLMVANQMEEWSELDRHTMEERQVQLKELINTERIFPLTDRISRQLDRKEFIKSHLVQPLTWIRVRDAYIEKVLGQLKDAGLSYELSPETKGAIGLEPSVNLESVLSGYQNHYEVQDLSSQRTIMDVDAEPGTSIWDCCAGSGGKTLGLAARQPELSFYVSDNRFPMIKNLEKRFREAGLRNYFTLHTDLAEIKDEHLSFFRSGRRGSTKIKKGGFDHILADVPCSGSGTWGRNPEWLGKFAPDHLIRNVDLQRKIITGILPFLKEGGVLFYITCSVYEQENEQNVQWMMDECEMELKEMKYFKGYGNRADTMFMAILSK